MSDVTRYSIPILIHQYMTKIVLTPLLVALRSTLRVCKCGSRAEPVGRIQLEEMSNVASGTGLRILNECAASVGVETR